MNNAPKIIFVFIYLFLFNSTMSAQTQPETNLQWVHRHITAMFQDSLQECTSWKLDFPHASDYEILFPTTDNAPCGVILDVRISIVYIPAHKWIFFKNGMTRKAFISIRYKNNQKSALKEFTFFEKIRGNATRLESPNYKWTIGRVSTSGKKLNPAWLEPAIIIGSSVVVIASLFFVRS